MKTHSEILEEIGPIVADILALEPEEVTPSSRFFADLGAESLEVLELSFRLEKRFGVKLPLHRLASPDDLPTDDRGRLTGDALSRFKGRYPFLDYAGFEEDPARDRIPHLLTVNAFAHFVVAALEEGGAQNGGPEAKPLAT